MLHKKEKALNIAEPINGSILIPNVSFGQFVFGSNIMSYLNDASYQYEENPDKMKGYGYDSYYFDKLDLEVWTDEKGIIKSVTTDNECYWNNVNIIGLRYEKFKKIFQLEPDAQDVCHLYDGTSQHVYDFYSIGLQVWVWYGIIRTIIANQAIDD